MRLAREVKGGAWQAVLLTRHQLWICLDARFSSREQGWNDGLQQYALNLPEPAPPSQPQGQSAYLLLPLIVPSSFLSASSTSSKNPACLSSLHATRAKPLCTPDQMTRTNKYNDRDHHHAAGPAEAERDLPKYFAKSGFVDTDPKKTKKEGGGKGNWGRDGDEVLDDDTVRMTKPRRRSNSFVDHPSNFKTKFEAVDPDPVFEEEVHGASEEDLAAAGLPASHHNNNNTNKLDDIPEGHDGFGFKSRADDASVGSSSYSVSGEDDFVASAVGKKH